LISTLYRTPDGALKQNLTEDEVRSAVRSKEGVLWVDFYKPTPEEIFALDELFGFHPLAIEDCQHVSQFPKLDDFGAHLFLIFLAPNPKFKPDTDPEKISTEEPVLELDMFLGVNFVVTYHISPLPFLNGLLERAKRDPKRVFNRGAVFLAHDILDAAVDQFFAMVAKFQDEAEEAEENLQKTGSEELLPGILELKRRVIRLRRQMSDHREVIQHLIRGNHSAVVPESHIYFRNILDHLNKIEDDLDVCRDTIDNARDVYLALSNVRTNQVMKVLTLVFALSLPFTVMTGWFGMNFDHLPFKEHPHGPWVYTAVMTLCAVAMIYWVRVKHWF